MRTDRPNPVDGVLNQMARQAQLTKLAVLGAAIIEGLLMAFALWRIDWQDDTQVLVFVCAVLAYTIFALGLAALGAHVSRVGLRVVAALERTSDA